MNKFRVVRQNDYSSQPRWFAQVRVPFLFWSRWRSCFYCGDDWGGVGLPITYNSEADARYGIEKWKTLEDQKKLPRVVIQVD